LAKITVTSAVSNMNPIAGKNAYPR